MHHAARFVMQHNLDGLRLLCACTPLSLSTSQALQDILPRVVVEDVGVANVGAEHLDGFVAALLLQREHTGAGARRLGEEVGAQAVPGEERRVVAGGGDAGLHHARDGTVGHGRGEGMVAVARPLAEQEAVRDLGPRDPGVQGAVQDTSKMWSQGLWRLPGWRVRLGDHESAASMTARSH